MLIYILEAYDRIPRSPETKNYFFRIFSWLVPSNFGTCSPFNCPLEDNT